MMKNKSTLKYKIIVYIFSIIFINLLQTTVVDYIKINNIKPNLILVYTISSSILEGSFGGGVIGLFAGLVHDILAGKILGFYALLGMYLGVIVGMANRRLYKDNILVVVFFSFAYTFIYELGVYLLSSFGKYSTNILYMLKNDLFTEALYNAGLSIIVHVIIIKINDKLITEGKSSIKY